jgi:hypothetical protein
MTFSVKCGKSQALTLDPRSLRLLVRPRNAEDPDPSLGFQFQRVCSEALGLQTWGFFLYGWARVMLRGLRHGDSFWVVRVLTSIARVSREITASAFSKRGPHKRILEEVAMARLPVSLARLLVRATRNRARPDGPSGGESVWLSASVSR